MESLKKSALGRDPVHDQTQPSSQASQESLFVDENENTVSALKVDGGGEVRPVGHLELSSQGLEQVADDQCSASGSGNIFPSQGRVTTKPSSEKSNSKFLQRMRGDDMFVKLAPASPCVPMPQPLLINTDAHFQIFKDEIDEEKLDVKNEIVGLESKLLDMWHNCSPGDIELIKKQDEEIISLQQMVKMLEESGKKKDEIINKYEENGQKKDEIINKYEAKLDHLSRQDQAMWKLNEQHKDLVSSLLAKESLERKTKFIQGTRKLQYHRTAPNKHIKLVLDKANTRLWEEKREQQKKEITRLVSVVDDISLKHQADADRYSFRSIILTNPVVQLTENEEVSVCKVFAALFLWA